MMFGYFHEMRRRATDPLALRDQKANIESAAKARDLVEQIA
jgi:hypothetical protein